MSITYINKQGIIDALEKKLQTEIDTHEADITNPHSVTKAQVGLEDVEDGAQINIIEKVNIDGVDLTPDVDKRITLPDKEPAFEKNTAFNKNFGNENDTVCEGNDARLSDARTPLSHTHDDRYYTESEIDTALGLKVDKNNAITAGTKAKITYDSKGLVTSGADLEESDIPTLSASKITQTTTARFVTDTEKSTWNGKQDALTNVTTAEIVTGTETTQNTVTAKVVHDAIMQIMFNSLGGES